MNRPVRHRARYAASSPPVHDTRTGKRAIWPVSALLTEWNQRNVPGTLDRARQLALVFCTGAGLSSRLNLAAIRDIPAQSSDIFVIDNADAVHAKMTDLASREVAVSAAATTAESSSSWRTTAGAVSRSAAPAFSFFCHVFRSSLCSRINIACARIPPPGLRCSARRGDRRARRHSVGRRHAAAGPRPDHRCEE